MSDLFTPALPIRNTVTLHFDGGTPCNIPAKGFGIGYGSYCFDGGVPVRVDHGIPCSNNAAEALTLLVALRHLAKLFNPAETKVAIESDSQIVLNQVTKAIGICTFKSKNKKPSGSDLFKQTIAELRGVLSLFGEVSVLWKPREHAVRKFGH